MTPASDNWVDQTRVEARTIDTIGNYSQIMSEFLKKNMVLIQKLDLL